MSISLSLSRSVHIQKLQGIINELQKCGAFECSVIGSLRVTQVHTRVYSNYAFISVVISQAVNPLTSGVELFLVQGIAVLQYWVVSFALMTKWKLIHSVTTGSTRGDEWHLKCIHTWKHAWVKRASACDFSC